MALSHLEAKMQNMVGLNINEAMLLCTLSDSDHLLAGEIAEKLGLSRSNASKVLASLERKSFICRQCCQHDSRCQIFTITRQGAQVLKQLENCQLQLPEELSFVNL